MLRVMELKVKFTICKTMIGASVYNAFLSKWHSTINMQAKNFPNLPPQLPARGTAHSRAWFRQLLFLQGWSFEGEIPDLPKGVAILMPHTSNYDAWYALIGILGLGVKISVLGKASLFKTPLKPLLEQVDVIPIQRNSKSGFTEQAIQIMQSREKIWIGLAPEGTRKHAQDLKTGFYRIATGANVPIVMFALDYQKKILRCLGALQPSGDYEQDLDKILTHYQGQFYPKRLEWLSEPLRKLL